MAATAAAPPLTWLYVPGDRPETVAKALGCGADVVIVDLEDAVAPDRKAYARAATAELLADPVTASPDAVPVHVRVHGEDDIRALTGLPGLSGLRLPKITHAVSVHHVAAVAPGVPLYPLLESALAVEHAYSIASAHHDVRGIALGEADLRADLGVREDFGLDFARSRLVVAARAAALPPPAQSVFPDVRDLDGLWTSCVRGRGLGLLGRAAIHPRQLEVIERAFRPTAREVEEAAEIIAASEVDAGALALPDGRFVDAAVVASARRTLAIAGRA
ncbi:MULTISPECIES: CoA ester lyase [Streptomyces]|uniref:HpcH/HpaI aldolase/citrate lyase family protein n=1 Tax=Streptomyces TaxID=1883 RepID=UPI0006AD2462|nr:MULTISPECIES: aldolase/citrate lyase family protein [Streptomyces]ALC32185.1 citrate lyase subunit beta [Streptomyces sp. CFMR 7]MBT3074226.1 CoA ester lyase [Streptomyces sp. COG21]MBT3084135.1 CoA ester lyase [Streptomyces sp. COG20]MBT3086346.1 CoA ester lyase [Streptomyces sp. CYG21]MBT3100896.1 CoA ester lyase [Streptomyces sp. CBG30]